MRHSARIAVLFSLALILTGCNSSSRPAGPYPATQSAYTPADGRNLAPELQRDFGADPLWPNDINRGGGGGVR